MFSENRAIRVLVVDDEEALIDDYRHILLSSSSRQRSEEFADLERDLFGAVAEDEEFPAVDLVTARQGQEAVNAVAGSLEQGNPISIAFIDLRLPPGINGLATAAKIRELNPTIQIVIVSAYSDLKISDLGKSVPPADRIFFIQKPFHAVEIQQFVIALSAKWKLDTLVASENPSPSVSSKADSSGGYNSLSTFPEALVVFDESNRLSSINGAAKNLLAPFGGQFSNGMLYEKFCSIIERPRRNPSARENSILHSLPLFAASRDNGAIKEVQTDDGKWLLWTTCETSDFQTVCQFFDITELKIQQAQKFQSEFQIHLTRAFRAVSNYLEPLTLELSGDTEDANTNYSNTNMPNESKNGSLAHVVQAVQAMAQSQKLDFELLKLEELVLETARKIRKRFGTKIDIEVVTGVGVWPVFADKSQVDEALRELVNNARDAMQDSGQILVEVSNMRLDKAFTDRFSGFRPGDYVMLSVTDDGQGMDFDLMSRALMPFFSSKGDKHQGIGLSKITGWVRQSGGYVVVESRPGDGTRVNIYLPKTVNAGGSESSGEEFERRGERIVLA